MHVRITQSNNHYPGFFSRTDCICVRWRDNLLRTICFMHLGPYPLQSYNMHILQRIERQWKIDLSLSCMPIQGKTIDVVLLIFAEYTETWKIVIVNTECLLVFHHFKPHCYRYIVECMYNIQR